MNEKLSPSTVGFALAAAVAVLFNTALAWAKDAYAPLNDFLKSILGHHWTTHGVADLVVFVVLGVVFTRAGVGSKLEAGRVINTLVGAVAVASVGLAVWFAFV